VRCSALQCVAVHIVGRGPVTTVCGDWSVAGVQMAQGTMRSSALQRVAVRCRALPCIAVRCRALPCVAVRCRASPVTTDGTGGVSRRCCSALQRASTNGTGSVSWRCCSALLYVAVCCRGSQRRCSVLQHIEPQQFLLLRLSPRSSVHVPS